MPVAFQAAYEDTSSGCAARNVTIDGGGSDRLIFVFWNSGRGALRTVSAATLGGVAADGIFNLGIDGGIATTGGYAYWLDTNNPGAGSHEVSLTWLGSNSDCTHTVLELTGVDQVTPIQTSSRVTSTATDQADDHQTSDTLASESGQFSVGWTGFTDDIDQTASGYATPSANLTERAELYVVRNRIAIGTDDSVASSSEAYTWNISVDGSANIDSIVSGIMAINAAAGGTDYTLTADAGSFAITGSAANLEHSYNLAADAGAVSITGFDAALSTAADVTLTADAGSFAITGSAANLEHGYSLAADAGSFAITGSDANLEHGFNLAADAGAVAITGFDATLSTAADITLTADAGSFAITGSDANLEHGFNLAADAGAVAITGFDATLSTAADITLTADAGSFAITGSAANLEHGYNLTADAGSFAITGFDATLSTSGAFTLTADAGSFAITGSAATLTYTRALTLAADAGSFAITGFDASLFSGAILTAEAGSYSIVGLDGTLQWYRKLTADAGSFTITGVDADLISSLVPEVVALVAGTQSIDRTISETQSILRTISNTGDLS